MSRTKRRTPGQGPRRRHIAKRPRPPPVAPRMYYAVRGGRDGFSGVLSNWEDVAVYTSGFPSAIYKTFPTFQEAQIFADPNGRGASAHALQSHQRNAQRTAQTDDNGFDDPLKIIVYSSGVCWKMGMNGGKAGYGVYFGLHSPYNYAGILSGRATVRRADVKAAAEALCIVSEHETVAESGVVELRTDSSVRISSIFFRRPQLGSICFLRANRHKFVIVILAQFVKNGLDFGIDNWQRTNWQHQDRTPVLNKDIWMEVAATRNQLRKRRITVHVVLVGGPSIHGLVEAAKLATSVREAGPNA